MTLYTAIKTLSEFGWGNILLIFVLITTALVACLELLKKLPELLGFETKAAIKERELNDKIAQLEKDIKALQGSAEKFNNDRINDRQQSFDKQTSLTDMINKITDTQNQIIKKVDDLAEQNRKYELADIRETLLQAYRYYTSPATNPTGRWTSMECHTFMEQYQNYIDRKGNSHMQEVVYPAMRKLIEIPMHEYDAISELMESRHKQKH